MRIARIASLTPNPDPYVQLSPEQLGKVLTDMESLLKNPRCDEFMKRLLNKLGENTGRTPYSEDPIKIFNEVAQQKGVFVDPNTLGGWAHGALDQHTARIGFGRIDSGPFSDWMNGRVGLHEKTHVGALGICVWAH